MSSTTDPTTTMNFVLEDSRRLTGANLIFAGPGAVIDVRCDPADASRLVPLWRRRAEEILAAVGWTAEACHVRAHATGVSLAISAPIDALYAATEVNEWALEAAVANLAGSGGQTASEAADRLRRLIEEERNPALVRLAEAAIQHGVTFLSDDDFASVGTGRGSRTWPAGDVPTPADVPWSEIFDVPTAMVTGTNGKTTTVRLLSAIVEAAGMTPGFSSTDGVYVAGGLVEGGDYSGPGGARTVLRDRRVDAAILETARGGMLRRGLGTPRADAVLVTNVGIDHLGEYGLHDIEHMADAKLVIARAVERGGALVLNADDPVLARRGSVGDSERVWFSRHPGREPVTSHIAAGGEAVVDRDGVIYRHGHGDAEALLDVAEAPLTLGGAAAYNVENVLGALALSPYLQVPTGRAIEAVRRFEPTPDSLPGRTNLFRLGSEVSAIVDFAHNPHGMRALADAVSGFEAKRRLVIVGQAGDRDDESIRELARSVLALEPDYVIVKELGRYLRGRVPGEVPGIIADELSRADGRVRVSTEASEIDAVRAALAWAESGDLLVFPVQAERDEVVALLTRLREGGWAPGQPIESGGRS